MILRWNKKYFLKFIGILVTIFVLLGTLQALNVFASANSDDNGNGGNSAKTFSLQSSDDYTKKADISKLVVNAGQSFPIYIYAINKGNAQSPAVVQAIPLQVTLFDPNNQQMVQTTATIPIGPANTYATLNLSAPYPGKWTVKVYGDPGKGYVTVSDTFTVLGNQAALNVIPTESTISLGSTQQFDALFTDSQGNTAPISNDPTEINIPTAFNYALFSGSPTSTLAMVGTNITIKGNVHSNKDFTASVYKMNISGSCEAVSTVQLNGNPDDIQIGNIVQYAQSVEMPDVGDPIVAMAQANGQIYDGDQSFNDTYVTFNTPIYVKGNLTINCNQFSGNGPIVATGNITINSTTLSVANNSPVCFYSKNGNITLGNSSVNLTGMVYAPNGTITMNGTYLTIFGHVIGREVVIHPNQLTIDCSNNDLSSLVTSGEPRLKWSSSDTSVASISADGLATGIGLGTCVITAVYTVNNVTYTDTSLLTVVPPSLIIDPENATIPLGASQRYQAFLEDFNGNPIEGPVQVTWTCSNSAVAAIDTLGTAAGIGVGTCTITATYQGSGFTAAASATLMVVTLSITPVNKIISLGSTLQYQAKFTDASGVETDVTPLINQWSAIRLNGSSLPATINQSGLVTANALGFCLIQATYIVKGISITASTPLTVIMPALTITPAASTILVGSTQQYQVILTDFDGGTKDVTSSVVWSSDRPSVASVNASGLATGSEVGTCSITANYTLNGESVSAAASLTVVNFKITPASATIPLGSNQQYQAEFIDADGKVTNVTESQAITWSSGNTGAATINAQGLATAHGVGESTISAIYNISGGSVSASASLTVVKPIFSITPANSTILLGSTQQFQATVTDIAGNAQDVTQSVTWSSDQPGIAIINSSSGLATGKGVGTCVITGTYVVNGVSLTATSTLEVINPSMALSLVVRPVPMTDAIFVGDKQQFCALIKYSDGSTTDVTNLVTWTSSDSSVASIDENGLASGISPGTSLISAALNLNNNPLTGSYLLTVLRRSGGIIREWEQ